MAAIRNITPLTAARVRELFEYDPETGVIRWRQAGRGRPLDRIAGSVYRNVGIQRRYIRIADKNYIASRIAWLYMTGEWPSKYIDHINCDALDDRWENLRLATPRQNQQNRRRTKRNKTGFKGVSFSRRHKKYRAGIKVHGKNIALGLYRNAEAAHAAYCAAAIKYFGEFARLD